MLQLSNDVPPYPFHLLTIIYTPSRWDVAALCVECIDAPDAKNAIFEVYNRNTAKPLASVGLRLE